MNMYVDLSEFRW